jgi:hypothetical protein
LRRHHFGHHLRFHQKLFDTLLFFPLMEPSATIGLLIGNQIKIR